LISGVVFVNGFTDAPNAIIGPVATKTVTYRRAVRFAAICNLLGLIVMSAVNNAVAGTVLSFMDFTGYGTIDSFIALVAAMTAIIIFAVAAWAFGIPSSESHALIAAMTGASMALGAPDFKFPASAWQKVLFGLVISVVLSFIAGVILSKAFERPLKRVPIKVLDLSQLFAAGAMAFMHGAQDGQKFTAVFIAAGFLFNQEITGDFSAYLPSVLLCGVLMALGTGAGGRRIIEHVGVKMVSLKKWRSVAADAAAGACLLFASLTGIPMSTTHTKMTAVMGACFFDKKKPVNYKIIGGILFAWLITFPASLALGFFFAKIMIFLS
jgi:PiT family inorganic phosphate transporter